MPIKLYEAIAFRSLLTADSYFGPISDNFGSWGMNPAAMYLIIAIILVVGVAVSATFVYNIYFKSNLDAGKEFSVTKSQDILNILTTALDQRSKIELGFSQENLQKTANCSIIDLQNKSLTLEFPSYINPRPQWIGKEVFCYFKIVGRKQNIFYHFTSTILDIDRSDPVVIQGQIALPDKLNLSQKRNHYRLEVPSNLIKVFSVWKIKYTDKQKLSPKPLSWGPPLLSLNAQPSAKIDLLDLSGGGVRIKIPVKALRAKGLDPEKDKHFFFKIGLWEPEKQKTETFWLVATARNIFQDHNSRDLEMGLQFMAQGFFQEEGQQHLTWKKVNTKDGVEDLTTWVFRRHVEIHRHEEASNF